MPLPTSSSNEPIRDLEFLISEANGQRSRAQGFIQALNDASTKYYGGLVLGQVTVPTLTATAAGGNTGNATIAVGTAANAPAPGTYKATCTDATHFSVTDPNAGVLGTGVFGTAFANAKGGIAFTITAGGTACVAGDYFSIVVPTTSGTWAPLSAFATDGTQTAAGILAMYTDVSGSTNPYAAIIVRSAEVKSLLLNWNGLTQGVQDAAIIALAALGIVIRTATN